MDPKDDEIIDDDIQEDDDALILEDDDEDEDDDLEVDLEEESAKQAREEKERNKAFASMRIENKKLQEQLTEVQTQIQEVAKPKPAPVDNGIPKTDAEWDALAEKDWKKAVDLRSNMNANQVVSQNKQAAKANETMELSKAKALQRHPELSDDDSEKSKIFLSILNNNPDYLNNPKGPIYAMRDMEEHMETVLGYKHSDIVSAERTGAKRESERQHRIVLNKGGGKKTPGNKNTVTLSKDEAEFCKIQGLDPKEFAKNKQKLSKSGKEGVTI